MNNLQNVNFPKAILSYLKEIDQIIDLYIFTENPIKELKINKKPFDAISNSLAKRHKVK